MSGDLILRTTKNRDGKNIAKVVNGAEFDDGIVRLIERIYSDDDLGYDDDDLGYDDNGIDYDER